MKPVPIDQMPYIQENVLNFYYLILSCEYYWFAVLSVAVRWEKQKNKKKQKKKWLFFILFLEL